MVEIEQAGAGSCWIVPGCVWASPLERCVLLCSPSSASKGSLMALTSIPDVDKQTQVMLPWWPSRICSCMA